MRIWIPTTLTDLATAHAAGEVPAGEGRLTAPEDEEQEYAALVEAAAASAALLVSRGQAGGRRTVLVAELGDADDPDGAVPMRRVQAVHVDTHEDAAEDDDLGWFATQEVPHLLRGEL